MGDLIFPKPDQFTAQQVQDDPILRYFHFAHLPPALREISEPFCALAGAVIATLPRNPERTVALRKLLEAKDAAVRANVPGAAGRKETFYDRLLAESKELEDKIHKLGDFIDPNLNGQFGDLPVEQQNLLTQQYDAMKVYALVLGRRIASAVNPRAAEELPVEGEVQVRNGDKSETPIPFGGEG